LNAAPTPIVSAPAPIVSAPVYSAPVTQSYDASKYQSRQYGSTDLTPGTAYIPTSIVNRSTADAQAVLNSGRTVAQSRTLGGTAPIATSSSYNTSSYGTSGFNSVSNTSGPIIARGPVVATAPSGVPASPVGPDGTYWEQVSGPTLFGNTLATKVVCKRHAPRPVAVQQRVQVVRPIVGVPVPVRYPVPVPVTCAPAHGKLKAPVFTGRHNGFAHHAAQHTNLGQNLRYGAASRWIQ